MKNVEQAINETLSKLLKEAKEAAKETKVSA